MQIPRQALGFLLAGFGVQLESVPQAPQRALNSISLSFCTLGRWWQVVLSLRLWGPSLGPAGPLSVSPLLLALLTWDLSFTMLSLVICPAQGTLGHISSWVSTWNLHPTSVHSLGLYSLNVLCLVVCVSH